MFSQLLHVGPGPHERTWGGGCSRFFDAIPVTEITKPTLSETQALKENHLFL